MNEKVFSIGPIRPPSEAKSLLLQVTEACTWNRCRFCDLYRGSRFRYASLEEMKQTIDDIAYYRDRIKGFSNDDGSLDHKAIMDDINYASYQGRHCYFMVYNWMAAGATSAFLQDANTLVLRPDYLVELLEYLREKLPEIQRVTSYGRADSLAKISHEDYVRLKKAGLDRIHSGYESGSDKVLSLINKGTTQAMQIEGGQKAVAAGLELSMYFMPGLGGKELSHENAIETAKVINAVNPQFVRLRTTVVKEGTELWSMMKSGEFIPSTDLEKLEEILLMLENIENAQGYLKSDHVINLLYEVEGFLDKDMDFMKNLIRDFLALPRKEIKRFQLAKRSGMVHSLRGFDKLSPAKLSQLDRIIDSVNLSPEKSLEWEKLLDKYLRNYI